MGINANKSIQKTRSPTGCFSDTMNLEPYEQGKPKSEISYIHDILVKIWHL